MDEEGITYPSFFLPKGDNSMNFIEPTSIRTATPTEQLVDRVQLLEEQLCNLTRMFLELQLGKQYCMVERMAMVDRNKDLRESIRKREYSKQIVSK
jgi:hypothetical protein